MELLQFYYSAELRVGPDPRIAVLLPVQIYRFYHQV